MHFARAGLPHKGKAKTGRCKVNGAHDMKQMLEALHALTKAIDRPLKLMEVCGTHTVEIFRHGIRDVIPKSITLLSGPGCPVCVTSVRDVDAAIAIAKMPNVIMTTFGDMMRVPGGKESLLD